MNDEGRRVKTPPAKDAPADQVNMFHCDSIPLVSNKPNPNAISKVLDRPDKSANHV